MKYNLGSIIPSFEATTTKGNISFYDWQGSSWVVLVSHIADFNSACTRELTRLARRAPKFTKLNTKCLALSVDSVKSHNEWIKEMMRNYTKIKGEFPIPIIADCDRELAINFGLIDEKHKKNPQYAPTIRALYIIDPSHKLRLSTYYPESCYRDSHEVLRCVESLQLIDRIPTIEIPVNWSDYTPVMVGSALSDEEAERMYPGMLNIPVPSGRSYLRTTYYNPADNAD